MMPKFQSFVVLFFLVFLVSSSARKLAAKQGKLDLQINNMISSEESDNLKGNDSFDKLMGMEECEKEDSECLKRRIVAEAHLDYIYTQNHKP